MTWVTDDQSISLTTEYFVFSSLIQVITLLPVKLQWSYVTSDILYIQRLIMEMKSLQPC